jgi:TolB-like protein/DNA-binding winged helix-turn-helix (wHTH) protein/Tfp pilus assembly protein PilF
VTTSIPSSGRLRFGNFEIDLRSGEVRRDGKRVRLQEQPFQVLRVLVERQGEIVTRDELKQILWPADTFVDFDDGLNTAVKKIRDVLGDSSERPRYIETIPRRGYRFLGKVEDVQASGITAPDLHAKAIPGEEKALADIPSGRLTPSSRRVLAGGVATLALLFFALVLYRTGSANHITQPTIKSLAVLPMKNLSGDATQEYLADGMTEAVIGRLAGIHDLRVISRTSSMQFKNTQLSVPEIAKTLRVDAVVEGSVIREGNRIRVHAQLIRASTDEHFWSETYDRELPDVLALQSEVAQSIARRVEVTVTGEEHARLKAARSVAPEVYEIYLKGRFGKNNSKMELEQSIAYFEEAIQKDPTFAPAYVGLAGAYDNLGTVFVGAPPAEARLKEISAAQKAMEIDPEIAEAHVLRAHVLQRRWQWAEAEAEYKRALELDSNDAAANRGFALWLLCQGRTEEAVAWVRRARELDPLGAAKSSIGYILFEARHYDEAIQELREALVMRPEDALNHWYLGFALIAKGNPEGAIPVLEKAVSLTDRAPGAIGLLIRAYAHAGKRSDALKLLAELKKRNETSYVPTGAFINAYLGLGDKEQTFVWLERACEEQSNILQFTKVHPFFDPIRDDPRFKDLLRRVGLDQVR